MIKRRVPFHKDSGRFLKDTNYSISLPLESVSSHRKRAKRSPRAYSMSGITRNGKIIASRYYLQRKRQQALSL